MNEKKIISTRLKQLCKEGEMSFYMLAASSGVPLTTIMNIINCTTKNPGVLTILQLCKGLGVTPAEFFSTEEFLTYSHPLL